MRHAACAIRHRLERRSDCCGAARLQRATRAWLRSEELAARRQREALALVERSAAAVRAGGSDAAAVAALHDALTLAARLEGKGWAEGVNDEPLSDGRRLLVRSQRVREVHAFLESRLLSGSTDGTVRLWDFEQLLNHDADPSATGGTAEPPPEYGDSKYDDSESRLESSPEMSLEVEDEPPLSYRDNYRAASDDY